MITSGRTSSPGKIIGLVLIIVLVFLLSPSVTFGQKKIKSKQKTQISFRFDQYVYVTLKDGSEVPARISAIKSKNQFYVRMIGGAKSGMVNKKFMRAMTKEEIESIRRTQSKTEIKSKP